MNANEKLLFLGDCNTLGPGALEGDAYPEKLGTVLGMSVQNCGHTMSTTREALHYFEHYYVQSNAKIRLICIQYGLVDAWETFKYSPYVLYYPDSKLRKLGRKLTKKFKKWCRALGLNALIGTRNVVPIEEYIDNIQTIINRANCPVILIETIPNKDVSRNQAIMRYNTAMAELAARHDNCYFLPIYNDFESALVDAYLDPTHMDETGHAYVSAKLHALLQQMSLASQYG